MEFSLKDTLAASTPERFALEEHKKFAVRQPANQSKIDPDWSIEAKKYNHLVTCYCTQEAAHIFQPHKREPACKKVRLWTSRLSLVPLK